MFFFVNIFRKSSRVQHLQVALKRLNNLEIRLTDVIPTNIWVFIFAKWIIVSVCNHKAEEEWEKVRKNFDRELLNDRLLSE